MPRQVLLIKAQGDFKHSGKYYLHNGRWHALHQDKPAPKGAPVAAHKHAAGQYAPVKHFTDDEWAKLQLPADNSNAGTFNKQLAALKQMSEAGDVTGILGAQFGTNTYGKKLATIANHLLGLHGSEHKVTAGQKSGEHTAVNQAPAEPAAAPTAKPAPQKAPAEPKAELAPTEPAAAPAAPATAKESSAVEPAAASGLSMPPFQEGKTKTGVKAYYEKVAQKIIDAGGDLAALEQLKADGLTPNKKGKVTNTWAGKTANSKILLALHEKAVELAGGQKPAAAAGDATDSKIAAAHAAGQMTRSVQNAITEAIEEEDDTSLKYFVNNYPEGTPTHEAAKAGLAQLKAKAAPAPAAEPAKAEAPAPAAEPAPAAASGSKLSQIPWDSLLLPDSNSNAKSHNGKVAQIKAMAEAGDIAGLEAFKAGKNTYGKKQNLLAHTALAALKEDAAAPAPAAAAPASLPESQKKLIDDIAAWPNGESHLKEILEGGNPAAASYAQSLLDKMPAAAEQGPKEGDTKQGATGMLVFKDGRWHKQEQPEPTAEQKAKIIAWMHAPEADEDQHLEGKQLFNGLPEEQKKAITVEAIAQQKAAMKQAEQHPIDAVPMPDLQWKYPSHQAKVEAALAKLKEQIKAEGPAALKGITKTMSASGKLITKLPGEYGPLKVVGSVNAPDSAGSKVHAYVEALKEAAGGKKAAKKAKPAPAATAAPHADQNTIPAMDGWKQIGPQGGSNPGGKFVDENGTEWYCKFPSDPDVAKSEVLAAKLYAAAGVAGQDAMLVTKGGKLGIASKWQEVKKASSPAELAKVDGVAAGFAADAWLGNWDVVGLGYDNLQVDAAGKAMRVDAGGSLEYRAQGGKKSFGNVVTELDSLRDAKINPQSAAVFGKLSNADITAGVSKVLKVSDAQIHALVNTFGPGDAAHKKALAETLIARKADLLAKFPKAKKEKKHTFKAEKISAPPSFLNWGGSGKDGPSSKPFLNQANEKAVQSIYEAAKTGSIDAVKNLTADTFNKNTGEVTGSAPVLEHPSQHVKGYAQQAINEINYQLNPPKRFRFEGGHPLESLHAAYPSHTGAHVDTVEKAGKFLVLGDPGTISLDSLALPKITHASGQLTKATYSPAAQAAINAMPETQKQAIKQYTGSSYVGMNTSLWSGNPTGAAKAAGEALKTMGHEIKPGTVLSRKLSVSGAALDQILKSTGKVLQEPAIMSTSIRPSSWGGNVHLKLHVGPGVKGLWVGYGSAGTNKALSVNAGEDELILPPNTRLLILSVKKSNGADADGFGASSQHVIEAVVLPTQQAN